MTKAMGDALAFELVQARVAFTDLPGLLRVSGEILAGWSNPPLPTDAVSGIAAGVSMRRMSDNFRLAWDLARRDLAAKYRRSALGLLWLLLTPLCLLVIYSTIFGGIFKVQWHELPGGHGQSIGFTLPFFVGLAVYLTLSDVVNTSSTLFASKRTYVIKSPFPLWVLWLANFERAAVQALVYLVLVLVLALIQSRLSLPGMLWCVLALMGCILFVAALSVLLAVLGPFLGDISEAVRLLLRVLFYATPITYPLTMVPEAYRDWMWLNPLTCMVEPLRSAIVYGAPPQSLPFMAFVCVSIFLLLLGMWMFGRVRGVISDVV